MPIYRQRSSTHTTPLAPSLIARASSALTGFVNPFDRSGHVFYQSADGHIQEISAKPGSNALHTDLSTSAKNKDHLGVSAQAATAGSALMSFVWTDEISEHVFYIGTDHHVHELYRVGTAAWSYSDLTAIRPSNGPNARAGSPLTGFTWQAGSTKEEHVFYIGTDNHVHELKQPKGAGFHDAWKPTDLTTQMTPPAPNARADSALTSFAWPAETSEHVFYVATVGGHDHVIELYRVGTAAWQHNDLTANASATAHPARAGSPLTGFTLQAWQTEREHVFYFGTDGHVHELMHNKGAPGAQAWQHNDLTANASIAAGATAHPARADSALTSFVWSRDQSAHVFYVSTVSHIREIYKQPRIDWIQGDVTIDTTPHAPDARADSALTSFAWHDDSEDVFYLTTDGHVHELWWLGAHGEHWQHGDVSESVV